MQQLFDWTWITCSRGTKIILFKKCFPKLSQKQWGIQPELKNFWERFGKTKMEYEIVSCNNIREWRLKKEKKMFTH